MGKTQLFAGSASITDLAYWMNERHSIYLKRAAGLPSPWTEDEILRKFKFTNVFRELDKGTIVLRRMTYHLEPKMCLWTIFWYRLFNHYEHDVVFKTYEELETYIRRKKGLGDKVFTSAHMTAGKADVSKVDYYLEACRDIYEALDTLLDDCSNASLEWMFHKFKEYQCIGPFVSYEIASDIRWYPNITITEPLDINSWANIGPGCRRGLTRLDLDHDVDSLRWLFKELPQYLTLDSPIEMREVEHSLCEFDKYQRVLTGAGRPRELFRGG